MEPAELNNEQPGLDSSNAGFAKDVLKLVSGTTLAQIIAFLLYPVISRLFSPSDFGVAAHFNSIISVLVIVSTLQFSASIMLPRSNREAANLLGLSLFFLVLTTGVTTLVVVWKGAELVGFFDVPFLTPYTGWIPAGLFFTGLFSTIMIWSMRNRSFTRISAAKVGLEVAISSTRVGAGLAGLASSTSLIFTSILGSVIANVILLAQIIRRDLKTILADLSLKEMATGAKKYWKMPVFHMWSELINVLSNQLPILLLTSYFSSEIAGYYAFGDRVMRTPILLVAEAMSRVFFQRASRAREDGTLKKLIEETYKRMVLLGFFPLFLMTLVGQDIFRVFFSAKWAEAGVYTQYLSLWIFFLFISYPFSSLFVVLEKQEYRAVFNLVLLASRFGALYAGSRLGDARMAIILFSVTGVLAWGWLCFWILSAAGFSLKNSILGLCKGLLTGLPFLLFVALGKWVLPLNSLLLVGLSVVSAAGYYTLVVSRDEMLKDMLKMVVRKIRSKKPENQGKA